MTTSTDAGVSWTVRPSRLAMVTITLPLSGVGGAGGEVSALEGGGVGAAAGFRAARLARLGAPFCSLPARVTFCGFGGETTTGSSVPGCCANAGVVRSRSGNAVPSSQLCLVEEAVHARRRDGARRLRIWEIDMTRSTANK